MPEREPVCFTCGQPVANDPFANRLASGEACPVCRARLLDEAPSLLPAEPEYSVDAEPDFASPEDDDGPIGA